MHYYPLQAIVLQTCTSESPALDIWDGSLLQHTPFLELWILNYYWSIYRWRNGSSFPDQSEIHLIGQSEHKNT